MSEDIIQPVGQESAQTSGKHFVSTIEPETKEEEISNKELTKEEAVERESVTESQPEEEANKKPRKWPNKKWLVIGGIAAVIVVVAVIFASQQSTKSSYNEYIDNLNNTATIMLSGAANAEDVCNTVKRVWTSAIFDSSSKWDADIKKYYSDDFNESIGMLYNDTSFASKIDELKANQSAVESYMKELQNPPEGCEEAYDEMKNLYVSYGNLVGLAISPTGTLTEYSSNFGDYDTQVASDLKVVIASIPEKLE